jgi:hypothetical protein
MRVTAHVEGAFTPEDLEQLHYNYLVPIRADVSLFGSYASVSFYVLASEGEDVPTTPIEAGQWALAKLATHSALHGVRNLQITVEGDD